MARAGRDEDSSSGETATYLRDGSQYSPSTTEHPSSSGSESSTSMTEASSDSSRVLEVHPHLNRLGVEDWEESEDLKYVRAVRAKITPAVEENPLRSAMSQKLDRPQCSRRQETCLAGWI